MAFPVAAVLAGVSVLGGILGSKGRKAIDPEVLKKLFGPEAVSQDTLAFFNNLINSPQGAAMLNQASVIGADISNRIQARAAQSGMSGGGSETGVGQFAGAAGGSAADLLKGQVRGNVFSEALQAAMQNNAARLGVYGQSKMMEQQTPTFSQALGAGLQSGAGMLAASGAFQKAPGVDVEAVQKAATNFVNQDIANNPPQLRGLSASPQFVPVGPPAGLGEGYTAGVMSAGRKKDRRF